MGRVMRTGDAEQIGHETDRHQLRLILRERDFLHDGLANDANVVVWLAIERNSLYNLGRPYSHQYCLVQPIPLSDDYNHLWRNLIELPPSLSQ